MKTITGIILTVFLTLGLSASTQQVAFNQKTFKFHRLSCTWAERCTVNCITIPIQKAIDLGGIPCKVCRPKI